MVVRVTESRKKSPVKAAEEIQQQIAGLDFSLEAVGGMTSELWCQLHDAQTAMEKAIALLTSYRDV